MATFFTLRACADGVVFEGEGDGSYGGRGQPDHLCDAAVLAFAGDEAVPVGEPDVAGGIDGDVAGLSLAEAVEEAEYRESAVPVEENPLTSLRPKFEIQRFPSPSMAMAEG